MMRKLLLGAGLLLVLGVGLLGWMSLQARADPVVRRAEVVLPGLAPGGRLTVALLSDIHIGTAVMGPHRLRRIVGQVNALRPDLVLIAGDFIFGHDPDSAARLGEVLVAPLGGLRARRGVFAVLGNHDHWTGAAAVRRLLARAGVTLLENRAVAAGPVALGGVGDEFSGHDDLRGTMQSARALGAPIVLLTHSPDIAPMLPRDAALLLTGHTHCGQAVVFGRPLAPEVSRHGGRYRCGLVREAGRTVVVTAGLGTSAVPLRIGAPPDIWLVTLTGQGLARR